MNTKQSETSWSTTVFPINVEYVLCNRLCLLNARVVGISISSVMFIFFVVVVFSSTPACLVILNALSSQTFKELLIKSFQNLVLSFITDHCVFPFSSNEYNMPDGVAECAWSQLYGTYIQLKGSILPCVWVILPFSVVTLTCQCVDCVYMF